jgi:hypothetical protein
VRITRGYGSPTLVLKQQPVNYDYILFITTHKRRVILCIFFSFIHMCIKCLGHFSPFTPLPSFDPVPSLSPKPPLFQAETVLPLSLILLKREYKQ